MAVGSKTKRLNIATLAVDAAARLMDAQRELQSLAADRLQAGTFADSDFTGSDLTHLTAATIGTLFDFVVPSLQTAIDDAANGGRNKNILLEVRKD